MTIKESIEAPRLHFEGNDLYYEPGIDLNSLDVPYFVSLHPFDVNNLFFGGVNAVTTSDGYSDSRRGGTCQIISNNK